jgi:hypothetical protein
MQIRGAILSVVLSSAGIMAHGQQSQSASQPNQSTIPPSQATPAPVQGRSAKGDIGSGSGDIGKGAAGGVGNAAEGVGKGAGDLVTLHPINAAGAVAKTLWSERQKGLGRS